jgi:hypothetical protein
MPFDRAIIKDKYVNDEREIDKHVHHNTTVLVAATLQ